MHPPAFDFLTRPPRSGKPRKLGLTVTSDKSKSLAEAASLIETLPDGIPFEVAAVEGKVPQFMARVAELGFKGVEISEDSLDLAPGSRLNAIRQAIANGLTVFTELGKKFPDQPLNAEEAIGTASRDIEAGTRLVVVEKSDVALVMKQGSDTLHRLVRGVGAEHIIIECGPGADRFDIAKWLIREFGPDVNLENIEAEDAYIIEAMRHGLHRAVDYNYFHAWHGRKVPPVPAP